MEGKILFYGTSSKFLKSILRRGGLSALHSLEGPDRLRGLNLTSSIVKALIQGGKTARKYGGSRLILVCHVSSKPPIGEDDLRTYFLNFDIEFDIVDPSSILHKIQTGRINLDKWIDKRISYMQEVGVDPNVIAVLKDNKKRIASMIVNFYAYQVSSKVESERPYLPEYFPSLVFVLKKGKPVYSLGYPLLKYPSRKWLADFKRDIGILTRLIGKVSHRLSKDDFSLRVKKVAFKGPDKIVAIFEEVELYSNVFNPVYISPGYNRYARLFLKKLSRHLRDIFPSGKDIIEDLKTKLDKFES